MNTQFIVDQYGVIESDLDERALGGGWLKSKSAENPNNPIDSDADWGYGTEAAVNVDHHSLLKIAAFWQGLTILSEDVAKTPFEKFKRDGKDREPAAKQRAYQMVRHQVNFEDGGQTAHSFWKTFVCHLKLFNNAYAWIVRDGSGNPVELFHLLPDRTSVEFVEGKKWYCSEIDGNLKFFDPYDVFHVSGISLNGHDGLDILKYAKDFVGKALARVKFTSKFFKNGGRVGGILTVPPEQKQYRDKIEKGFRKTYESPDEAFKTVVAREGVKFTTAQQSFADTQLVEVGEQDIQDAARLLNMPPFKIGGKTGKSYTNRESENRDYYDQSLSPIMVSIAAQANLRLRSKNERDSDSHYYEHHIQSLLWADVKTVSEIGGNGIQNTWLVPNEVRRWFNMPGIEGGDERVIPLNMQIGVGAGVDDDDDSEAERALKPIFEETKTRFLKRLTTKYDKSVKDSRDLVFLNKEIREQIEFGNDMFSRVNQAFQQLRLSVPESPETIVENFVKEKKNGK